MIVGLARLMTACALGLVLCAGPAQAVPPMSAAAVADAETWATLKDSRDIDALRAFAEKPRNRFAAQARARIRQLDADAPPPPPGVDPKAALAAMLRFDSVAQMRAVATTAPAPAVQLASSAPPPPPPAAQAPPPAQALPASDSGPPAAIPVAPAVEAGQAPAPPSPPPEPANPAPPAQTARTYVDVGAASRLVAQPRDPLARPPMRVYDKPMLPAAFCRQEDMNSYLTDFHKPLYAAAWANNEDASRHMNELNVVFATAKAASGPGATDRVLLIGGELQAYTKEADDRFKAAEAIRDLDPLIRKIPIEPRAGCASAPWPPPTKPSATAVAAAG